MFPIRNVKGEVIAFGGRVLDKGEPKYLNSPETPVFSKGRELYGLFEARQGLRDKGYVLVTEGYMDVVALAQLGFPQRRRHAGHGLHRRARAQAAALHREGDLQLRRRRRRPPRRRPRAGGRAAPRHRYAQLPLSFPAQGTRSGQLRARTRHEGVRAVRAGRAAAVAAADRGRAARLRHGEPPRAAPACSRRPSRCGARCPRARCRSSC